MKNVLTCLNMDMRGFAKSLADDPDFVISSLKDFSNASSFSSVLDEFMVYMTTEGPSLTHQISEFIAPLTWDGAEDDRLELSRHVRRMSDNISLLSRVIKRERLWAHIYGGKGMPVIAVWRDKESEEIVGTPSPRNVVATDIDARLCSLASVEQNSGTKAMVVVSNGMHNTNSSDGRHIRQDFLIDLSDLIGKGISSPVTSVTARSTRTILSEMALTVLSFIEAAETLEKASIDANDVSLKPSGGIYEKLKAIEVASRELKPEENPNALIEIGGWA